jgi:cell division protease FtsH
MRMSQSGPPDPANAARWRRWLFPLAVAALFLVLLVLPRGAAPGTELSYTRFVADVGAGNVRAVTIDPAGQVTGTLAGGHPFTTTIPAALGGNGLADDLAAHHVQVTATAAMPASLLPALIGMLPLLLIGGLLFFVIRGVRRQGGGSGGPIGGLSSLTRAKARVIDAERPVTRFTDVAGYAAVKTEISEVVDYLRDPGRYHRAGARGPHGVLMAGPPGTGKTLLARAVAGEAHVPFFSVSGSGFVEMFVGVGAARVRDLFEQARTRGPAIVFIDEIDALGTRSDHGGFAGNDAPRSHSEHAQWLVDQEVAAILTKAETRARDLLTSHQEALNQLTTTLLEQETVTGDQVRALVQAASPTALPAGTPAAFHPAQ